MSGSETRCRHNLIICSQCVIVTDAAKRISDAIRLAIAFNPPDVTRNGWMAFALEDGTTDHVVYPSKQDAINHQHNEFYFTYINLIRCLAGMNERDAQLFLNVSRHVAKHSGRMVDPKSQLITPQGREQKITRLVNPLQRYGKNWHWDN